MAFITEVPDEEATFIQTEEEKREETLLRVRREGLTRLEFGADKQLIPSLENLRILGIEAEQKKSSLTRADVIQKLQGYKLITNKLNTTTRRWTRYIDKEDGFLRAGGFPIRNEPNEEFIVMKNVSKRFTFSINRERVILMEKIPKNAAELISVPAQDLIRDFRSRDGSGVQYVALKDDFTEVKSEENNTALARTIEVNRGALGRKFRSNAGKHKEWFLFRLGFDDIRDLREQIPLQDAVLQGIPDNLQAVIDRFYPERPRDIEEEEKAEILEEEEEEDDELSELFDLAELFEEVIAEEADKEQQITDLMVEMLEDPSLDRRIRKLLGELDPQDTITGREIEDMLKILKKIQSGTLLEREEGAFLKVLRTRFRNREEKEEEERIINILIQGEEQGIAPIDNPLLAEIGLGTIIRLTGELERRQERDIELQQEFIEEFLETKEELAEQQEQFLEDLGIDLADIEEEVDEFGREPLTDNSLEFWINDTLLSHIGVIVDKKRIKELLDAREDEIGRTYVLQSITRSANKLAEKRYLLKLGGKYVKAQ